jgi:hypothetical protein
MRPSAPWPSRPLVRLLALSRRGGPKEGSVPLDCVTGGLWLMPLGAESIPRKACLRSFNSSRSLLLRVLHEAWSSWASNNL